MHSILMAGAAMDGKCPDDPLEPQGAALILELPSLARVQTKVRVSCKLQSHGAQRVMVRHASGVRPAGRSKKGRIGRAIGVCLEQFSQSLPDQVRNKSEQPAALPPRRPAQSLRPKTAPDQRVEARVG
jgi:hypothetical protein